MADLKGRLCLITGSGSGVGRAAAILFAKAGCHLVLWDLNAEGLQETAQLVKDTGLDCRVHCQTVDVAARQEVYAAALECNARASPLHVSILVNNAGILGGKGILETDDERIIKTFEVNALSHIWTCKAFLPAMISNKQGHVVTVASATGLRTVPLMVPYGASKHAAVGFGHGLRKELKVLGHHYIKTSLICPALIKTKLFEGSKQPLVGALTPFYVAKQIVLSVKTENPYVVLPLIGDLTVLRALPVGVQDRLESMFGLDTLMNHVNMDHAEGVLTRIESKSKL